MELERVWAIAMGRVTFEILGKVDDGDRLEGAPLNAQTATCASTGKIGQRQKANSFESAIVIKAHSRSSNGTYIIQQYHLPIQRGSEI